MWDTSTKFYGNGFEREKSDEDLKKCYSTCSIGKTCLKYRPEEDDIKLMVALRQR